MGTIKKKQTIILIVLVTSLIVIGLGTISNAIIKDRLAQNLLDEYQQQEYLIGTQVAGNLENSMLATQEKLQLIASMPEVRSGNTEVCNQKLAEAFTVLTSKVGNLGRVNADGYFQCSLNKALIGVKAEKLGEYITRIFNDPEHKPVLSRMIVPPGANSYVTALHVPVYDAAGKFQGTVGGAVYLDELQAKYLENIRLARNGFVMVVDSNGDILYHPEEDLIGKNVDDQDVKRRYGQTPNFSEGMKRAAAGESGKMRYFYNDQERIAAYQPAQVLAGHHWTVVVAVPTKDAAAELSRVGVDGAFIWFTVVLSLAVAMIAAMMMINLLKSYEMQKTKDDFVNLASHQLRTPATAVMDYIDLVLDGIAGKITPKQRELLEVAKESNLRQIRIIGDMLNVARLDAQRLNLKPEPTELRELIAKIIAEQKATIEGRNQTIEYNHEGSAVHAPLDGTYGRMVFENLISNASKYTPKGGKIKVTLTVRGGMAVILVKDNGVGVAKQDMNKLFVKLGRIPNELSDEVGGTGLGLYLVKQIVERHNGRIEVKSSPRSGSEFTVYLPL